MPVTLKRLETREVILPSNGRKWEWIDGEAVLVPTGFEHDAIAGLVYRLLFDTAVGHGVLTISQAHFRMESGNVRSPGVGFTRFERLPKGERLPGGYLDFAPDLCVEVISRSESREERAKKVREYFASGASLVWELFPATKTVQVHASPTDSALLAETDTLDAPSLIPGFSCRVADCFAIPGWPRETACVSEIDGLIQRLDAWLQENRPEYYAATRRWGLQMKKSSFLEASLDTQLPEDFKKFLQNGKTSKGRTK